jgi:hypothetical protein
VSSLVARLVPAWAIRSRSDHDDDGATARDRYGDHVGEIALYPTDGLMDAPHPRTGHVGLHLRWMSCSPGA